MATGTRPFGVSLVTILVVLNGLLGVVVGILALIGDGEARIRGAALGVLIVGIVYLLVAKGLWNGNSFSRLLVGIATVLQLIGGVFILIFGGDQRWSGLGSVIFSLIILGLIYGKRARVYFS